MDYTEIIIEINSKDIEIASAIANMVVPYGIYIEDYSNLEAETLEIAHIDLIDDELISKNRDVCLIHVYIAPENNPLEAISFLQQRYNAANIKNNISTKNCKIEDYINNWKKYFKPVPIGKKLLICPSWEKTNTTTTNRVVLQLDPGLAFGTGNHETTKLCLSFLEEYIKSGDTVLDIGCGSGILSVAALLLGASKAIGVDIDELAVKTAIENAKVNNVDEKFTAVCGNLTEKISGKYNIVVANIVADVIIKLNENVKDYMNENTIYLMSGIIEPYKNDVLSSLSKNFDILKIITENEWVAIAAKIKK